MFQRLSKYLFQYKQLSIPHVGRIGLEHQPAVLNMGEKLIYPPSLTLRYVEGASEMGNHQFQSLSLGKESGATTINEQLETLGKQIQQHLHSEAFVWKGLGKFEKSNDVIQFSPEPLRGFGLQPIPAQKLVRQNVAHAVLRGETEGLSSDAQQTQKKTRSIKERFSPTIVAGWILVALAIAFISFYLYQNKFSPSSSGSQMKVIPNRIEPSHK